jgi:hypothetical protein
MQILSRRFLFAKLFFELSLLSFLLAHRLELGGTAGLAVENPSDGIALVSWGNTLGPLKTKLVNPVSGKLDLFPALLSALLLGHH